LANSQAVTFAFGHAIFCGMNPIAADSLLAYWSAQEISTNILVFLNILGALLLGLIVGYERSYHGRAAGMRTYGLVCMASAALTVIAGYPAFWYAGQGAAHISPDPTRIIQGIVTGIGFLGAGVIVKEGFNISGLTTAASIWTASAIGIMVGVGFYGAAILVTLLSAACMWWMLRLEKWLPSRPAITVTISFNERAVGIEHFLGEATARYGYRISQDTVVISHQDGKAEWRFLAIAENSLGIHSSGNLARDFAAFEGIESFQLCHPRN